MKKQLKTDRILSVLAFVISIATLIALMYQSNLVREQNNLIQKEQYASVMPYLTMGFMGSEDDSRFEFILRNDGVGPAFIKDINIRYQDSLYKMSIIDFYTKIIKSKNDSVRVIRTDIAKGTVIPANKKIELLVFYTNQEKAIEFFGPLATLEASVEITYASIYDKKWILKGLDNLHNPID